MAVDSEDLPVIVYRGEYEEVLFLTSLLNGSSIPATMFSPVQRTRIQPPCVYVPRRYLAAARPLVEDFVRNGKKTSL